MTALIVFGIFSLPGWIMLIYALRSRRARERREERERARTTGRVVEYVRQTKRYRRGPTIHFTWPVVEFRAEGQTVRRQYENSLSPEQYPVGASVDVVYDADDPTRFHLDADVDFSQGAVSYARMGIVWILVCAVLAVALTMVVGSPLIRRVTGPTAARRTEQVNLSARDGAYRYEVRGDRTAIINGYSGDDEALTLPLALDGHPVTAISSQAFARAKRLKRLTIPGMISKIPMAAFAGCLSLQEVTVREGVADIGKHAFGFCISLKDVYLPRSLSRIDEAFPEDCGARFHVAEGSYARRFCEEKGYAVVTDQNAP